MDRVTENERRPNGVRDISSALECGDDHVVAFPSQLAPGRSSEHCPQYVSDVEIAHLVSIALEDALAALGQPNPETCLRLRACEARAGIREMLIALPHSRARDDDVVKEYRRALVLQNLAFELALNLMSAIRRYARVREREIPADIA